MCACVCISLDALPEPYLPSMHFICPPSLFSVLPLHFHIYHICSFHGFTAATTAWHYSFSSLRHLSLSLSCSYSVPLLSPFYLRKHMHTAQHCTFEPFAFAAFEMLHQRIGFEHIQTYRYNEGRGRGRMEDTMRSLLRAFITQSVLDLDLVLMFIPLRTSIQRAFKIEPNKGRYMCAYVCVRQTKVRGMHVPCECMCACTMYVVKRKIPTFYAVYAPMFGIRFFFQSVTLKSEYICNALYKCSLKRECVRYSREWVSEKRVQLPLQMCMHSIALTRIYKSH